MIKEREKEVACLQVVFFEATARIERKSTSLTGLELIYSSGGGQNARKKVSLSCDRFINGLVVEDSEDHSCHLVERDRGEPGFGLLDWPLRCMLVVVQESGQGHSQSQVHQVSCTVVSQPTRVLVETHVRGPPLPPHFIYHAGRHSCEM